MTQLPIIYVLQASDAPQQTGRLQEILQNLESENRIGNFTMLGAEDELSSLTENIKDEDLILIVLTNQLESQKERIEQRFRDFKTSRPEVRIAEIIVDNVVYENAFITFPEDLRPIRNSEDMDAAWRGIGQSLRELFPKKEKKSQEPVPAPTPAGWAKYLKIAGILIGVVLLFFIIRGFVNSGSSGSLMTDDFSNGNMNGWTIVDEGTSRAPSNWSVVGGEVQQSSNIYGPSPRSTDNRKGTIAFYDNSEAFSWTNYSLAATLRATDNDGIGLVFRYQNANNYYKLELDAQRTFSKLFKIVNGVETTLAHETETGYTQNAYFNLEVRVISNQIRAFQNDTDIFGGPITDHSFTNGTVGLYCWGNENSYFDNVSVNPL